MYACIEVCAKACMACCVYTSVCECRVVWIVGAYGSHWTILDAGSTLRLVCVSCCCTQGRLIWKLLDSHVFGSHLLVGTQSSGFFCRVWVFKLSLMLARPVLDALSHIPSPCISFINVINEDFRVDRNEGLLGFWWWS